MNRTTFRRTQFTGLTDQYARAKQGNFTAPIQAETVKGVDPKHVIASVLGDLYVRQSETRLTQYEQSWRVFRGEHFDNPVDRHLTKTVVNFCKNATRKRATWAVGRGLRFKSLAGNEFVSEVLMSVWKANRGSELLRSLTRTSLITGDGFLFFDVCSVDGEGQTLPKDQWKVKIVQLNPAYVFPYWKESDPDKLSAAVISFPAYMQLKADAPPEEALFTMVITEREVTKYVNNELSSREVNQLKMIPIVHLPNEKNVDTCFGTSLVNELFTLNRSYNETLHSIRRVVDYYGEPTTIVYGTKLSQMERGVGKVWSNLPTHTESKVEMLELSGDLKAVYECLKTLEAQMYITARTPKICYDSDGLAVSNTSGVAMALLFQPLVEATIEAQESLAAAITRGNEIIAAIHAAVFGEKLSELADDSSRYLDIETEFVSIMPRDEAAEVDIALKKREAKIWSHAETVRQIGNVNDTERLAAELAADRMAEWIDSLNKARALEGNSINMKGAFVGSLFLSEDLLDEASKMPSISGESIADPGSSASSGDAEET